MKYASIKQIGRPRESSGPHTQRDQGEGHHPRESSPAKKIAKRSRARLETDRRPGEGLNRKASYVLKPGGPVQGLRLTLSYVDECCRITPEQRSQIFEKRGCHSL